MAPGILRPLFRNEVLRDRMAAFLVPSAAEEARGKLRKQAELLLRRNRPGYTEKQLAGQFVAEVFGELLGYRLPASGGERVTLVPEFPLPGGTADAVIGESPAAGGAIAAVVELKGPDDPLDHACGGRKLSAVRQAFDYALNAPCEWIIVSSMLETRLYSKSMGYYACEVFRLDRVAEDDQQFRRFVYILGADRVVPRTGECHLGALARDSKAAGDVLTNEYYAEYSQIRQEMFALLAAANPGVAKTAVLAAAQKILDRTIFCAFCEDRSLIPAESLKKAFQTVYAYGDLPKWENFRGLFRAIDVGNPKLGITKYNGGLFAPDPLLDGLAVPDAVCGLLVRFARYDYGVPGEGAAEGRQVDVEILGHIFEQSITDLERFRMELEGRAEPADAKKAKARRKKEGAFYTPKLITRYIVEETLGAALAERFEGLRARHAAAAPKGAQGALASPRAADAASAKAAAREALALFWSEWQAELATFAILDPACGSGAFLIEAFDQLYAAYEEANRELGRYERRLEGEVHTFDLNRTILQRNLYGVDVNDEAVDICRLSLWIKTAESGKVLADLDHTIRAGNSIIADPAAHPRAFDWQGAFPEVFARGGFDVVIGNPPYIRQEWIAPYKEYLKAHYRAFSGTADFYLYFIERGLSLLREGGRLGMITSGTFARGNFAKPFREWLPTVARYSSLVNFGENQPFEDAEMVYPTISILERSTEPKPFATLFLHDDVPKELGPVVRAEGFPCEQDVLLDKEWRFQPRAISDLFARLAGTGRPLREAVEGRMFRGILTGLNEAFIVDTATRDRLVKEDPGCAPILRKLLMGEDLRPWYQDWEGRWLICALRGIEISKYPSVLAHLEQFRELLEPRPLNWKGGTDSWPGRKPGSYKWYELQDSIDYFAEFDQPKVFWPDIAKLPRFSWDEEKYLVNDKGYIVSTSSHGMFAVLISRAIWFCISQMCVPLRLRGGLWQYQSKLQFMERLPIPPMKKSDEKALGELAVSATAVARERLALHRAGRHRIATDFPAAAGAPGKVNNALSAWWTLDFARFREELGKAFGTDVPVRERADWESALAQWRGDHERLTARLVAAEEEINARVYRLFGMSDADVRLLEDFQQRTKTFYPLGSE